MGKIIKDALTTKSGTVHKRERVTHSELFIFKKTNWYCHFIIRSRLSNSEICCLRACQIRKIITGKNLEQEVITNKQVWVILLKSIKVHLKEPRFNWLGIL